MCDNNNIFKPIIFFGYFLILMGGASMFVFVIEYRFFEYLFLKYFCFIVSIFHLFVGLGIIFKEKWGYYLFKLYLYLIAVGFPIGTLIGLKMLKYINDNNIKSRYFKGF
ncbi:hypothetical protein OOT00_04750 [Desulfobotulus sp. H1]|uniref:Uncharacterized protein n=1 Tax=Desulfobotulus pelophilus TaxID=2823377 RepID=A0ABT3N753_9BACT|nr:hypothetical protein [Desulfobotulus pelophilus]MCW7753293.1 hypothetical protein [Desulfobotulus pelophilus]